MPAWEKTTKCRTDERVGFEFRYHSLPVITGVKKRHGTTALGEPVGDVMEQWIDVGVSKVPIRLKVILAVKQNVRPFCPRALIGKVVSQWVGELQFLADLAAEIARIEQRVRASVLR